MDGNDEIRGVNRDDDSDPSPPAPADVPAATVWIRIPIDWLTEKPLDVLPGEPQLAHPVAGVAREPHTAAIPGFPALPPNV